MLSPEEQDHIEKGTVGGGMTKEAVLMAYGYPPSHRTPSLSMDTWTYWTGRGTTTLTFKKNRLFIIDADAPDISATRIRKLAFEGKNFRSLVPKPVYRYIQKLRLYGER